MWPNIVNHSYWNYTGGWKPCPPLLIGDAECVANATTWVAIYWRNSARYANDMLTQLTIPWWNLLFWSWHSVDNIIARGHD